MFFTFNSFDPKNLNHSRNINNTDKFDYNCGGYALGTFSWYTPFNEPTYIDLETPDDYDEIEEIAVENILHDFPDLSLVSPINVRNKDINYKTTEIIAFRFSEDDFHFWKLGKNSTWYDKMGGSTIIRTHSYSEVFAPWGRYNGRIYFFTRTRA